MTDHNVTRRDFVADTAKLALGAMIVPRHVLGGPGYQAPSDTLNVAIIGTGGMGATNAEALVTQNLVAFCDVDFGFVQRNIGENAKDRDGKPRATSVQLMDKFTKAKKYADFREMLDKQKDIEAVVIATPDHLHAVVAKAAMESGKHVYVQKPLCYSVHEARVLRATAQETGVVTQMGNQGHSSEGARQINEWIQAKIIGPVREVHVWTNRPIWPQGIARPPLPSTLQPVTNGAGLSWNIRTVNETLANAMAGNYPVPQGMNWDLYLGPAPETAYHPVYHPFNWRGWVDFGVGALGDMGAHLIDHPFWALGLGYPTSIEASSTPFGGWRGKPPETYPQAMTVHYEFPERGAQPRVSMTWYDGGLMPRRPDVLPDDVPLLREGGVIFVGERGILLHETYGRNPRIFPDALMQEALKVPKTYTRIDTSHELNWALACKGQAKESSPISYASMLTETMLLGIVALRTGQGKKILYDGEAMRVTNVPEANQYLTRDYRTGWSV